MKQDFIPLENYTGCLLGGAIGDALGAPVEFLSLNQILNRFGPDGILEYVEFTDGKGRITDDTQMTIFTAEAVLRFLNRSRQRGIWGAYLQITYDSYLRWLHTQGEKLPQLPGGRPKLDGWIIRNRELFSRRAPGNTCLGALRSGIQGTMERPINNSKGCGGIMRVAPVGLMRGFSPEEIFKIGAELAAITHGHPSGYLSAGAFAALLAFLKEGYMLRKALLETLKILESYTRHEETTQALKKAIDLSESVEPTFENINKLGEGWVGEEALAISVFCALHHKNDFKKAVNLAVTHNGDTDSTGAITGNIVGLYCGERKIPEDWIKNLEMNEFIKQIAIDIYREKEIDSFTIDFQWNEKYPPV